MEIIWKGKKRKIKTEGKDAAEDVVITGAPPLKWVLYARQILSEGVDESWAVYDKDKHPKHEEALAEADKVIDGKKVNIAFSSPVHPAAAQLQRLDIGVQLHFSIQA